MEQFPQLARFIRYLILSATTAAGSGHPTSSLSAVELMIGLCFGGFYHYNLDNPDYHNNDRLIFSKGHAAPLLYALYVAAGKLSETELHTLRQFTSPLEGHPTRRFVYTEAATGSLGQGLSIGVGIAMNAKYLDKVSYRTFVLLGDSEMAEGQVWEAIQLAAHYQLHNLIGIIDVNRLGQRGETMYGHDPYTYAYKLRAFGWDTIVIDGHNFAEIAQAYQKAVQSVDKPVMIIARTLKGKGVSFLEDREHKHGKALTQEELRRALTELGPVDKTLRGTISQPSAGEVQLPTLQPTQLSLAQAENGSLATRKAFGNEVTRLALQDPSVVVVDAELSNSTYTDIFKNAFPERFFEMFIAEQNMVSAAQGLSHRGKKVFVSTYGAFLSRAFDQIRMAQYSSANLKCVGSHNGVATGQDGASQMGLEDIALFRSIRESVVLYPSDATSTTQLVRLMAEYEGISYLRTTRLDTPPLYDENESFMIGGSKTLRQSPVDLVTVAAAGITVHEALKAYDFLVQEGIAIRVIDVYSVKPLDINTLLKAAKQTKAIITVEDHYQAGGIGEAVALALSGKNVLIRSLCVKKVPHSGTPDELLAYEGLDAAAIVSTVKELL